MRTNIIMEEPLVYAAQKATGIKTKTGVVHYALREVVRRQQMKELLKLRGKVKFWDGYVDGARQGLSRPSAMLILPDSSAWISFFAGQTGRKLRTNSEKLIEVEADVCVCGPLSWRFFRASGSTSSTGRSRPSSTTASIWMSTRDTFREAAQIYRTCRARASPSAAASTASSAPRHCSTSAWLLHNDRDFDAIAKFFPLKFF